MIISSAHDGLPVTGVGNKAFKENENLASLTLREGVKRVGHNVFNTCENLEKITLPESLTEFGNHA